MDPRWTYLDLGHATISLVFVGAHQREGASALAVETHVLRIGLSQAELMAVLGKQTDGESIAVNVARCESLVSHVEERIQVSFLDQARQLPPLLRFRVDARGVVSARVQQNNRFFWNFLEQRDKSIIKRHANIYIWSLH